MVRSTLPPGVRSETVSPTLVPLSKVRIPSVVRCPRRFLAAISLRDEPRACLVDPNRVRSRRVAKSGPATVARSTQGAPRSLAKVGSRSFVYKQFMSNSCSVNPCSQLLGCFAKKPRISAGLVPAIPILRLETLFFSKESIRLNSAIWAVYHLCTSPSGNCRCPLMWVDCRPNGARRRRRQRPLYGSATDLAPAGSEATARNRRSSGATRSGLFWQTQRPRCSNPPVSWV
jgi:hypothetical protein